MATLLLITNVLIVDGTGAAPRAGSVRIEGDRITAVGTDLRPQAGEQVVDGHGHVLAPGFIDTHSHHDRKASEQADMLAATSQGVTTIIVGQDGGSNYPLSDFFAKLASHPVAVNVGSYSGHNTLRAAALEGTDVRRPSTPEELAKMRKMLEDDMRTGSFGLSTGLIYEPGVFSGPEEALELAKVSARMGGRYISHIRSETFDLDEAIRETIEVGRQTRAPVQVSHIKIAIHKRWGEANRVIELLEKARAEGIDITADVYPYTYWQSTMRVMFPSKNFNNREELSVTFQESTKPDQLILQRYDAEPSLAGNTIAAIATLRGKDPVTAYIDLMQGALTYEAANPSKGGSESVIGVSMSEEDVETFIRWPHANICSDGAHDGHPRGHGTFPRVLGKYVRESKVLSLEQAVHKMTALAARHLGLGGRGTITPGAFADLALFDPAKVADRATIANPKALAFGIEKVWVNGRVVYEDGRVTGQRPGRALRASTARLTALKPVSAD